VLGSTVRRLTIDVPNLVAGTMPEEAYDARFVRHPWLDSFGPAFWISFTLHALVAELWLRARPLPPD
jgi:hypothetical protein